jgi:hypothetical protein
MDDTSRGRKITTASKFYCQALKFEVRDTVPFFGHWRYTVARYSDCHHSSDKGKFSK